MTIAQRAVRGTVIVLASSYTNMAIGIVYGIIMARLLEPAHFGIFQLGMFFFTLFDLRNKLGLDYALIHHPSTTSELIATHWTLQTGMAMLSLLLISLAAALIVRLDYPSATAPIMIALAVFMMIEATGTTARALLEKELVFARSTLVVTGSLFFSYLAAIGLAMLGCTYWALVGQVAVNAALSSAGFWWTFRHVQPRPTIRFHFNRAIALWLLRFGLVVSIGALATTILLMFDNFLVGTFVGAVALGYYAQAYKVAQWPTGLVTHIVARVSLPTYAKLQHDAQRLSKAFELSLWIILTVALPLALAIFVSAPDFLLLLYGEKWLPSAVLLRFLIGYSTLRPLLDDTGAFFTATGQPNKIATVLVVQAITLIICATPLTLAFGAVGTAIGVGIAFALGIALTYRFVSRVIALDLPHLFLPPAIAAVGSIALYWTIANVMDFNVLPLLLRVLMKGGIAVAVFLLLILLLERQQLTTRVQYVWKFLASSST